MNEALQLGADLYGGLNWLYSVREKVCPNNTARGGYLFNGRLHCLKRNAKVGRREFAIANVLEVFHLSLTAAGGTLEYTKPVESRFTGEEFSSEEFDFMALFKNPVADLKGLFPSHYDNCGRATDFKDPTFGGMFKLGNANEILIRIPRACNEQDQR